jgi:hypothetical protein
MHLELCYDDKVDLSVPDIFQKRLKPSGKPIYGGGQNIFYPHISTMEREVSIISQNNYLYLVEKLNKVSALCALYQGEAYFARVINSSLRLS